MAPPNDPSISTLNFLNHDSSEKCFDLSNGIFNVKGVPILSNVPTNVTFSSFLSLCKSWDAPLPILQRVQSSSTRGGFFSLTKDSPSEMTTNSLGKFLNRNFLSIFRFKTWWSTQWVGTSGSDLQKETQWVLLDVPETGSYLLILPIIDGQFRSSLHPGNGGHVLISVESGSTHVKASSFPTIAYVHVCDNPYTLMKEAFAAIRVHLNTFKLLEEKTLPPIVDKFGWCTWDAFYLTVEPAGIWHGLNELVKGGVTPRFLIIDDGWQSINFDSDSPDWDAKGLVLGGEQMTGRLHRLDEGEKFRNYKSGSLLGPDALQFDPERPKMMIDKAIEIEKASKEFKKLLQSGADVSWLDSKMKRLKKELNEMFSDYHNKGSGNGICKTDESGLKAFTRDLRKKFKGLDEIYVWHALCGAWGGIRPGSTHLHSRIIPCQLSPGLDNTMPDLAVEKIIEGGIGLVHPTQTDDFYDSMHSYLASAGITGVKVDVIHTLEYVSEEFGGRVELAKAYYNGLTKSMTKNFNGTGVLASMQQCNDFFYLGTKQISFGRVGDDFWFQDPNGDPKGVYWLQGVHMVHCAYNSLWMGQMIQPDWDMFQSDHVCAKYHAGARAICGGPVYLSDSLNSHDFDLIKQLVFPDGTVPRCQHFALPTRDCLFKNPLFDNNSILKIFNFNKFGGVIGAFNCQGAGWDNRQLRITGYPECYKPVSGTVHVKDIEWDQKAEASHMAKADKYIVYLNQADQLLPITTKSQPISLTLQPSTFEIFSFVPVKKLGPDTDFAAIGLTNMFNSVGTIQGMEDFVESREGDDQVGVKVKLKVKVKGKGKFLAYSGKCPKTCVLNGEEIGFEWGNDGSLILNLPWMEETAGVSDLEFVF
ncbi:stachyose synthase [Carica papaya]|uniref:stachyose synthase n=1 Tax=Carica papaya TaxID=3649 RepID=UPI000B8CA421|nr:stachyose synthase [Carica papaya]